MQGASVGLVVLTRRECADCPRVEPNVLRQRLTLGPILIAIVVLGLWADEWLATQPVPGWASSFLSGSTLPGGLIVLPIMLLLCTTASRELSRILRRKGVDSTLPIMASGAALGLLTVASAAWMHQLVTPITAVALAGSCGTAVMITALLHASRRKKLEGTLAAAGGALLSYVYLGLMAGFALLLRSEHSAWVLLWVLMVTKSCDIGAYFTGKSIGKHKLIPWLSPGKTWEGLIGGVVVSSIVGAAGMYWLHSAGKSDHALWLALFAGALFGIVGQAGDLVASMFKRDAAVKDAGGSLPGFGGVLDVLDSPLLVMPVAFWWLRIWGA